MLNDICQFLNGMLKIGNKLHDNYVYNEEKRVC